MRTSDVLRLRKGRYQLLLVDLQQLILILEGVNYVLVGSIQGCGGNSLISLEILLKLLGLLRLRQNDSARVVLLSTSSLLLWQVCIVYSIYDFRI